MTGEDKQRYSAALDVLEDMAVAASVAPDSHDALVALYHSDGCPLCRTRPLPDDCLGCPGHEAEVDHRDACTFAMDARDALVWAEDEEARDVVVSNWREAIAACRKWLAAQ